MNKILLNSEEQLMNEIEDAKRKEELYKLQTTYNYYRRLLLKIKNEYERSEPISSELQDYNIRCYYNQSSKLLTSFYEDKCLMLEKDGGIYDRIFLLSDGQMLKLGYSYNVNSHGGLASVNYKILRIADLYGKIYEEDNIVDYRDYSVVRENKFGLFPDEKKQHQGYNLTEQLKKYDGVDIREILSITSVDEIFGQITDAKKENVKKLIRTK